MFGGVLCFLMLVLFENLKKDFFYVFDTYLNLRVSEAATKSCSTAL